MAALDERATGAAGLDDATSGTEPTTPDLDAIEELPEQTEAEVPSGTHDENAAAEAPPENAESSAEAAERSPETPQAAEAEAESRVRRPRAPWWPFLIYLGLWIVGVGAAAWLFLSEPAAGSVAGESMYPFVLRAGLVLTALGPVLALVVWLISWLAASRGTRAGLFADSMLKGALTTLSGVVVWWLMLMIVDRVRFDQLW